MGICCSKQKNENIKIKNNKIVEDKLQTGFKN